MSKKVDSVLYWLSFSTDLNLGFTYLGNLSQNDGIDSVAQIPKSGQRSFGGVLRECWEDSGATFCPME